MGWKLKALAILFALLALGAGALILAVPLLLYALLPWVLSRRNGRDRSGDTRRGNPLRWINYLGIFFVVLCVMALASGGRFSVLVLGGVGAGLLYLGKQWRSGFPGFLVPEEESIMLRDRLFPLRWFSVAEVKVGNGDWSRALASLNERFVVMTEKARALVVLQASALTEADAERKAVARVGEMSKLLGPAGVYLLPLEASEALPLLRQRCKEVDVDAGSLDHSLATQPYDTLVVQPSGHLVAALGAYRVDETQRQRLVAEAKRVLKKPVLVWEVTKALETRVKAAGPDDATVFLSSLAATRGADIGERIVQTSSGGNVLLVKSLRTPEVQLTRAQVRALVRAYA
jgi:hypothetical protein